MLTRIFMIGNSKQLWSKLSFFPHRQQLTTEVKRLQASIFSISYINSFATLINRNTVRYQKWAARRSHTCWQNILFAHSILTKTFFKLKMTNRCLETWLNWPLITIIFISKLNIIFKSNDHSSVNHRIWATRRDYQQHEKPQLESRNLIR